MAEKHIDSTNLMVEASVNSEYMPVWDQFRLTNDILVRTRDKELKQFGINHEYETTLFLIHHLGDKATPAEIARQRYRRPHTVSNMLMTMQKEGLVNKCSDLSRKNLIRVELTEKGERAYLNAQQLQQSIINAVFSGLSVEEIEIFRNYLERLRLNTIHEFSQVYRERLIEDPIGEDFTSETLALSLWRLMRRANDIMYRFRDYDLSRHGLSIRLSSVLYTIHRLNDRATSAEIARWRYRKPNTISNILIRSERKGLVKRLHDLEQKNQIRIILTDEGRQAYQKSMQCDSVKRMISILTREEIDELRNILTKLQTEALAES